MKRILKILGALLLIPAVLAAAYIAYAYVAYDRVPDRLPLTAEGGGSEGEAPVGERQTVMTWNLGFGAYSADYGFFMDGGTESWAFSEGAVRENLSTALATLRRENADFILLQELDEDATRSYHVDEVRLARVGLEGWASVYAQNYNSPYLLYPLHQPHGASKAGIMTFSDVPIASATRRSLPVESGFMRYLDLDRCYSVCRIPTSNGRRLCLYNLHLSAYTSDGAIANRQLELLTGDMVRESEAGNYVIAGGDFNKDLLGNSGEIFGVSGEAFTWAQPLPAGIIPWSLTLVSSLDAENPVPSCRNADGPYVPGESFVLTVDGFIVSKNVRVESCEVLDLGFAVSDHNPVRMTFVLEDD